MIEKGVLEALLDCYAMDVWHEARTRARLEEMSKDSGEAARLLSNFADMDKRRAGLRREQIMGYVLSFGHELPPLHPREEMPS